MGSKADKAVFTVTGITLLTFLIASRVGTIWVLYPNVLIAVALFIYCIRQIDEDASLLSNSSVFGLAMTLTYLPMDWLFSRKAGLIFYLRSDFLASVTTPIGVILNWAVFATLAAYCYQRLVVILRTCFADEIRRFEDGSRGNRCAGSDCNGYWCCVWKCRYLRAGCVTFVGMERCAGGSDAPDCIGTGFCAGQFFAYLLVVSLLFWCGW